MADIEIQVPGFYTSVQDLGRRGTAQFGIPQSGAMDAHSARKANLLLNNDANDALLEVTFSGPALSFNCTTTICVCGAQFDLKLNNTSISNDKAVLVQPGDQLKFGKLQEGFRAYLAFSGGIQSPEILGSRSQYDGLTSSFRLGKGDTLDLKKLPNPEKSLASVQFDDSALMDKNIEVVPGAEYNKLSSEQKNQITSQEYKITPDSNRMAIQLEESVPNDLENITTATTRPGTVQLTPSGRLVILMRDCQVTGGYPRILQLSEMGINILAQQAPGSLITFRMLVK